MLTERNGWGEMRPGRKIVLALFFLFLLAQYLVYAVYIATYSRFDNPAVLSFNHALQDYYEITEWLFPNQISWWLFHDAPLIVDLPVVGLLNLVSAFGLYLLMVWRRWPAWLVIPGYFLGSILFTILLFLTVWGR